ncbi:MAG: UMP kinase [Proteobacteria bacterium]|jgi:uridylate kinase|nr:UMP kinase [Pseudomonadota bacterium]
MTVRKLVYHRALLKLSGEMLAGAQGFGIEAKALLYLAQEIAQARGLGSEIAVVPGGGNILRGAKASREGMDRVTADYIGMLATLINSLLLAEVLKRIGVETLVLNAFPVGGMVEPYRADLGLSKLEAGQVLILSGGTGNPMLSTDTAAALRARELTCEILLKGTKVDGVYDADPAKVKKARRFEILTYKKVMGQGLKVMDLSAIALCEEGEIPIRVFNLWKKGSLVRILQGEPVGTLVRK